MTDPVAPAPSAAGTVSWPDDVAGRYVEHGYWLQRPLGHLLREAADRHPDSCALVDGARRWSHAELADQADATAIGLLDLGIGADDRIVVQLPNTAEFVILILACLRIGAQPVMALPAHRRHEMTHLTQHSEAVAIAIPAVLKDFDHRAMAADIAAEAPTVRHLLVLGETTEPGDVDLGGLCRRIPHPDDRRRLNALELDPASVAVFLLSGGTTGLPKLIARSHNDYAYNALQSSEVCGFDTSTVYYAALPIGHNFPLACPGILGTLLVGGKIVIGSPDPAKAFQLIAAEGVTASALVPAVAQRWLAYRAEHDDHDLSSLVVLQVGGARIADEVATRIKPVLGCTLQQVFGMAEGLLNYTRLNDPDEVIWHTQGRPMCEDDELLVVDELGRPVEPGEPGVLLTRGPYTPRGYYRAAEQNARSFTSDGWYRTGDIVRLRPDGNLIVEGRDKDMILRGGENISAEEVENFAYLHPGVHLAAAVAMPDVDLGERVCLYVVPQAGAEVTLDQLRDLMETAGAARYKFPERLVLVPELLTTKVGKIDKKSLRADISARIASQASA